MLFPTILDRNNLPTTSPPQNDQPQDFRLTREEGLYARAKTRRSRRDEVEVEVALIGLTERTGCYNRPRPMPQTRVWRRSSLLPFLARWYHPPQKSLRLKNKDTKQPHDSETTPTYRIVSTIHPFNLASTTKNPSPILLASYPPTTPNATQKRPHKPF